MRLYDELNDLHAVYVEAVNTAVAAADTEAVDRLAAEYDDAAVSLTSQHEGGARLLSLPRQPATSTPLRRLVERLRLQRAA